MRMDHVYILLIVPPNLARGEIMRWIKGSTPSHLFEKFSHLKKRHWGAALFGARVLLYDGRSDNRGDDSAVSSERKVFLKRLTPVFDFSAREVEYRGSYL